MRALLEFFVLGLGQGALIAGIALALVLFYRGSGTINLAAGCVAMVTGYVYWALTNGTFGVHVATGPALLISVVASVLQGVMIELCVLRPLRAAPAVAKMVATLGLFLLAQSLVIIVFGPNEQSEPSILPQSTVRILGAPIGIDQLILVGIVIATSTVLTGVYRWTEFGLRTRAAAENERFAALAGLSSSGLSLANSVLACVVAGLLGTLAAPLITLDSTILPLLVVPALTAALFARFTSFAVAALVGLCLGAAENILYYLSTRSWFPTTQGIAPPGIEDLLVFLVMLVAVFWRGSKLPRRHDIIERRLPVVPRPAHTLRSATGSMIVGAAALTLLPYDFRAPLMMSISGTVLALSMIVITGFVGQVSVVQPVLSGAAGFLTAHLADNAGLGFPWAPLAAIAGATVLGVLVAIGGLRLRGVQLAVVSLAAAVAITSFWFSNYTWGSGPNALVVAQPVLFGLKLGANAGFRGLDGKVPSPVLGYGILAVCVALCVVVCRLRQSRLGRQMLAVRSNERAAASVAINVARTKVKAFALSATLAGTAGVLAAYTIGTVSAGQFSVVASLTVIAFAYVGGISRVSGAAIAGLWSAGGLAQYAMQQWFGVSGVWIDLVFAGAVLITVTLWPDGLAAVRPRMLLARLTARRDPEPRPT